MGNVSADRVKTVQFRFEISLQTLRVSTGSKTFNMSDISKVFELDDIFTRKDAISGLKSSSRTGL